MAGPSTVTPEPPVRYIGCCGAYCRTCRAFHENACRGCKLGYDRGDRDIARARCAMKACCFRERRLETCADCPDYPDCEIIGGFHRKRGYKYQRYRESIEYIRQQGYSRFIAVADGWNGPYGKLGMTAGIERQPDPGRDGDDTSAPATGSRP